MMDVLLRVSVEAKEENGQLPSPDAVRVMAEDYLADRTRSDYEYRWMVRAVAAPEVSSDREAVMLAGRFFGHAEDMDPELRLWLLGVLAGALMRLYGITAEEYVSLQRDVPDLARQLRELANELEDAGAQERPAMLRAAANALEEKG